MALPKHWLIGIFFKGLIHHFRDRTILIPALLQIKRHDQSVQYGDGIPKLDQHRKQRVTCSKTPGTTCRNLSASSPPNSLSIGRLFWHFISEGSTPTATTTWSAFNSSPLSRVSRIGSFGYPRMAWTERPGFHLTPRLLTFFHCPMTQMTRKNEGHVDHLRETPGWCCVPSRCQFFDMATLIRFPKILLQSTTILFPPTRFW